MAGWRVVCLDGETDPKKPHRFEKIVFHIKRPYKRWVAQERCPRCRRTLVVV